MPMTVIPSPYTSPRLDPALQGKYPHMSYHLSRPHLSSPLHIPLPLPALIVVSATH